VRDEEVGDPQAVLASIMASSADAIVGQRLDGAIVLWNAGAEHTYGWTASEMLGTSIRRVIPQDLEQELEFIFARVSEGERVRELLTRRLRKDGRVLDISLTVSPIRDGEGRVAGILTIERDVTRRRRIEAIVQGQRRMLEALTRTGNLVDGLRELLDSLQGLTAGDVSPCVMLVNEERRILAPSASRLPARLLQPLRAGVHVAPGGHPAGEAAFKRQAVSIPDFEEARGFDAVRGAALEAGFRSCCSIPILSTEGQVRGTLDLYRELAGDPRPDDLEVAGALAQTAALAIDRIETVRELRESREVLLALNSINARLAADLDVERIIHRATEEATRLLGAQMGAFFYGEIETEGLGFRLYGLAGEKAQQFASLPVPRNTPLFSQTLTGGALQRLDDVTEDPRYGKNEPNRGIPPVHPPVRSFMSAPVRSRSGEILGMFLFGHEEPARFSKWHEEILRGISAQTALTLDNARLFRQATERAAALAEADRRKDEFLATIGHELRGPLAAITAAIPVIEAGAGADREAVEILDRQATHMKRLVNDLLEVSRITRGKILLKRETIDAREAVRQAVRAARHAAAERSQAIELTVSEEPAWISADAVRLEQIVGNLLGNALKFSPPRGLVRVSVGQDAQSMVLTVRDEGSGIPPKRLKAIFDMFVQGDDEQSRGTQGGLGLGLTLVRELVKLHGGGVAARSEGPGRGSEFEVRLPRCEAPAPGAAPAPPPAKPALLPVLRILLVEDDIDAGRSMVLLLRHLGHKAVHVADGREALDRAASVRPDAALLDIGLPGMDGWEVAKRLREVPGMEALRLAALTGRGQPLDGHRSRQAGFDRHFVKPADPAELTAWLEAVAAAIPV
jgi:PAS domain S-box-containing protein